MEKGKWTISSEDFGLLTPVKNHNNNLLLMTLFDALIFKSNKNTWLSHDTFCNTYVFLGLSTAPLLRLQTQTSSTLHIPSVLWPVSTTKPYNSKLFWINCEVVFTKVKVFDLYLLDPSTVKLLYDHETFDHLDLGGLNLAACVMMFTLLN